MTSFVAMLSLYTFQSLISTSMALNFGEIACKSQKVISGLDNSFKSLLSRGLEIFLYTCPVTNFGSYGGVVFSDSACSVSLFPVFFVG
jgi:hypothetical protein